MRSRRRLLPRIPKSDRLHGIMSGQARDPLAIGLRLVTNLGTPPYRLATGVRNTLYNLGVMPSKPLGRPTISVGNITAGGTGKTPMVIELVRRLQAMGHQPAVLMRGYEPAGLESKKGSDEAAVLRGSLGGDVPVMANPSRIDGARDVLADRPEVSVFVLDDGFQHRRAHRDLNLVLVDASVPFGFGRVLPRGLLREPIGNLKRADQVIVTRADRVDPDELAELDQRIERLTGRPPLAHARHHWANMRQGYKDLPVEYLANKTVLGCSGVGNPSDFEKSMREVAGKCVGHIVFEDHRNYNRTDISGVFHTAEERGADAVIITEKDWVKWRKKAGGVKSTLPIFRPVVQMQFIDGGEAVDHAIAEAAGSPEPQPTERET
ncbi:tetraacyldisaccharide 4'-kinase [Algisphaera agarilytica]|uniref:Tetraacyldisaccharide 4'-kinase n=1 Tax=Algisphaera agarilytica TaxID=1385975 RepID=A0A7X0LJS1_9BACT|nr:tetraacyldisaccharide 4'-kinase [Algisphaera agarilytica]MBB6429675.1 tetraacyldisaccharide 4'-kinase [Algisphaera agarilytica]